MLNIFKWKKSKNILLSKTLSYENIFAIFPNALKKDSSNFGNFKHNTLGLILKLLSGVLSKLPEKLKITCSNLLHLAFFCKTFNRDFKII